MPIDYKYISLDSSFSLPVTFRPQFQVMASPNGASRQSSLDKLPSVRPLWVKIKPKQRPLPHNTQQTQEKGIQAAGGIRTCNSSKRAAANRAAAGIGTLRLTHIINCLKNGKYSKH